MIVSAVMIYVMTGSGPDPAVADAVNSPLVSPASGGYIKLGDIKGEATDKAHDGWIEVISMSQAITRQMASGITGSTRQRASAQYGDLILAKELDKSSPKLQEAVANGTHFPTITLELT
jgi:type VI secretion system secreted protein Hcp